jgi:predicted nucleic acid-binding protein
MKPLEQVDEIDIPADLFKSKIISKLKSHEVGRWDNLLDFPPYIQWENIKLVDNRLFIERSAKPLDKLSRYPGVAGAIECEIILSGDKTIIKARIE